MFGEDDECLCGDCEDIRVQRAKRAPQGVSDRDPWPNDEVAGDIAEPQLADHYYEQASRLKHFSDVSVTDADVARALMMAAFEMGYEIAAFEEPRPPKTSEVNEYADTISEALSQVAACDEPL